MALDDIYQVRSQLEEGIRQLFEAQIIVALTRANAPQKFQQATPRVEIKCTIGAANGHRFICPDGFARFDRWRCTIALQAVTRPSNDGTSALHEQFLGRIRNIMSTFSQETQQDKVLFPNIRMAQPVRDAGDRNVLKTEEGIEYSVLTFNGTVCIEESAWLILPPAVISH